MTRREQIERIADQIRELFPPGHKRRGKALEIIQALEDAGDPENPPIDPPEPDPGG